MASLQKEAKLKILFWMKCEWRKKILLELPRNKTGCQYWQLFGLISEKETPKEDSFVVEDTEEIKEEDVDIPKVAEVQSKNEISLRI